MHDWKIRQEIYHKLNTVYDDDLKDQLIELSSNVIQDAIRYFTEKNIGWIYPSKSYMVGICYARWLAESYGGSPLEYLNDEDLLYKNDPYFVTYNKDSKIYIDILAAIGGWEFDESAGMVPDVKEYFNKEFMLNEE